MNKTAYLIAGLKYGDEGKGATADFLVRQHDAGLVVRYNGGAQAAHNVVLPDGRHHTFSQFGSGTFVPNVKTHLSKFMLVNPLNMIPEAENLRKLGVNDAWDRLTVSKEALIITPFQIALNRLQEMARGNNRHGSCGQGVGQCRSDFLNYGGKVLFAGDFGSELTVKRKLEFIQLKCIKEIDKMDAGLTFSPAMNEQLDILQRMDLIDWCWEQYKKWPAKVVGEGWMEMYLSDSKGKSIVFEGAQGVLLDETHGDAPYNTWTDTTFNNAHTLLTEAGFTDKRMEIGVLRTYATRHGAGPLAREYADGGQYQRKVYPEPHNCKNDYQGSFRLGAFDEESVFRALRIVKDVHGVAINHLDRSTTPDFVKWFEKTFLCPVVIEGFGPTHKDRIWKG